MFKFYISLKTLFSHQVTHKVRLIIKSSYLCFIRTLAKL
jgi:hypothetical protein